jgi:2'-5' RNA ligase
MGWAVILLPDDDARRRAEAVWRAVRDAGFPSGLFEGDNQPHITLTLLATQNGTLGDAARRFASAQPPVRVFFSEIGQFYPSVVYLAPQPQGELLAMNRALTAQLGPLQALADPHYLPGSFLPHMTMAFKLLPEDERAALAAVRRSFLPFGATFHELAVVKFNPVKIVERVPLTEKTL